MDNSEMQITLTNTVPVTGLDIEPSSHVQFVIYLYKKTVASPL